MIIEYTYSPEDLKKRCFGCKWLKQNVLNPTSTNSNFDWYGLCECPHNKIKNRNRSITDKACSWKNADKHIDLCDIMCQ